MIENKKQLFNYLYLQNKITKNILANIYGDRALMKDCEHHQTYVDFDEEFFYEVCLNCGNVRVKGKDDK